MHLTSIEQNTQSWLDFRKNKIGASDAPIIMEVSPWRTPLQLWEEKVLPFANAPISTPAMERGKRLEPVALAWYNEQMGDEMVPAVAVSDSHPWMIASFDGVSGKTNRIVEIKHPNGDDHRSARDGIIPVKYYPQLQHQLFVSGYDIVDYVSGYDDEYVVVTVERDDDYIENLVAKEFDFLQKLKTFTPPSPGPRDYVHRDDSDWSTAAQRWIEVQHQIKQWEEEEAALRKRLIDMSGGQNAMGCGIKLNRIARKGNVDYSAIPQLKDVDLEQFRKPCIVSYRLSQETVRA